MIRFQGAFVYNVNESFNVILLRADIVVSAPSVQKTLLSPLKGLTSLLKTIVVYFQGCV